MNLSRPPAQYDLDDQASLRRLLEAADAANIKKNTVQGKIIMRDTADGSLWSVTVASGALVVTAL